MNPASKPFKYSDHLPTITTIDGLKFCTWNVLFQKWLSMNIGPKGDGHIAKYFNQLATMDPETRNSGILLTIYDLLKLEKIDVLALQEFDPANLNTLRQFLQHLGNYNLVLPSDLNGYDNVSEEELTSKNSNDLQIVIYCKDTIKHNVGKSHMTYYMNKKDNSKKISKRIMNLSLSTEFSTEFRFVNTHVLFMEINQLATYLNNIKKPDNQKNLDIIIAGDMNQVDKPNNLNGLSVDHNIVVYNNDKLELKYTHIDTKGNYVFYDHIWNIVI